LWNFRSATGPTGEAATLHHNGESKWKELRKKELVASFNTVAKTTGVLVVAHNKGLTVNQVNDLRNKMAKAGATVKVVKNRLAMRALEGTDAAGIAGLFKGPTMVAYGADPVSAPKVAADFAKANEKFVVLGGALGKTILDANGVKALAELPSLDQLRGKIIGLIQAPATKIAGVLAGTRRPVGPRVQCLCHQELSKAC
jgi:large subunit ribosomal protein L10